VQISREEANQALDEIDRTTERVCELRSYRHAAPHLLVWGTVWLVANLASSLYPAAAGNTWLILTVLGVAASVSLGAAARWRARNSGLTLRQRQKWQKFLLSFCAFAGFQILSVVVATNHSSMAALDVQIYLLVALAYVLMGIWSGSRIAWLGLVLAAATMFGLLVLPRYFALWMGLIGGGLLIGTGLWLRTA
jgi:hypothetical protein